MNTVLVCLMSEIKLSCTCFLQYNSFLCKSVTKAFGRDRSNSDYKTTTAIMIIIIMNVLFCHIVIIFFFI